MSGYIAFLKKELMENTRNFKLLSILALFFVFGLTGPVMAKFMPEIAATFIPEMDTVLGEPVVLDSWDQFFKNISQLGMSITIIIFSSILSTEYSKGTLVIMLTKGLSRTSVILSKFTVSVIIMTISYWSAFVVTCLYNKILWPNEMLSNVVFSAFGLWLIGVMYLAINILGGVLFTHAFANVCFMLATTTAITFIGIPEPMSNYTPMILTSRNSDLISGAVSPSYFAIPIVITLIIIVTCLSTSIVLFNKKQL